jgi:hypothetical protein
MPTVAEVRDDVLRQRALYDALADVLAREDWPALAAVDQSIADYLRGAACCDDDPQRLHARLRLKALHGQARKRCEQECRRLREQLRDYLERAEGRSAYQQSELWQVGAL